MISNREARTTLVVAALLLGAPGGARAHGLITDPPARNAYCGLVTKPDQVTNGTGHSGLPIWSANGQWLFYRTDQNGTSWAIYAIRLDGSSAYKITDAPVNGDDWTYEKLAIAP